MIPMPKAKGRGPDALTRAVNASLSKMRVGIGYDSHRYSKERKLYLGGMLIAGEAGLLGHSDADVVLHAITDAVLGAASQRDIGHFFPDNDDRYLNMQSSKFLEKAVDIIAKLGFRVINADVTIIAERPKMAPHIDAMKKSVAKQLKVRASDIGIKAKTNEKMGFVGREEGMAAIAVVMLGPL
jgi:2-C-methyl-D-erythritol 2,4-cyclodiphosphate synthase